MERFELAVIGGGPGGYLAAERAAHAGKRVVLFEMRALGGVCLNEGCIPSKALLNSAKLYEHSLHGSAYGVTCQGVTIDQKAVVARKNKVVKTLVSGVRSKMRGAGVTVVMKKAVFQGKDGDAFVISTGDETYAAENVIIATGSSNVIPPLPGLQENLGSFVLTNREILDLQELPKELVVVGGGVIGLEMACYFSAVGVHVTVVEMLDHIAGATDGEISALLQKDLQKKGITFLLGHKVESIAPGKVEVDSGNGKLTLPADKVLLSIGRRANCRDLGLETVGVSFDRAISTDSFGRTNVPGIYAIGDVNGHHMLAHTAYREAEVAVNHLLGKADMVRYHANPSVIYTQPEVAAVGKTEEECRQKGIDYEVQKLPMVYSGRFVAENEGADGLCKVIIDKKKRNILGVHMLGSYAGEIIWGGAQMIELQLRVTDARQIIFPHPTVSEIIRETLWEFPD